MMTLLLTLVRGIWLARPAGRYQTPRTARAAERVDERRVWWRVNWADECCW